MKHLRDLTELEGVKALVRLDLNVPVDSGVVSDDFRIRKILPTLDFLREKGAKIILMSHIESAGGHKGDKPSLEPVAHHLGKLGAACELVKDYRNALEKIENMEPRDIILLENLRMHEGETSNDRKFAQELASLGDVYVNEAFAVSHRAHASVSAITEFMPSCAGLLFADEVRHLRSAFNPLHPFLFMLCGAKFETKLPLIEKFMEIADKVFVGGALANNFFKEQGKDIGASLVSPENYNLGHFLANPKLLLPVDDVIVDTAILDVGPETIKLLEKEIAAARFILWNGPLGAYESGYTGPTLEVARMIAAATERGATSILGGGDTLGAIDELNIEDRFTFVSTGGGAMLEFLAKGTLPGIEALETSRA